MKRLWLYLIILSIKFNAFSDNLIESKACIPLNPVFTTHNVFSKNEPNYFWLLGVANDLHITTLESTLTLALASFSQCQSEIDTYEVERYLRKRSYLRDAKVSFITDKNKKNRLHVETWDNWTLQPSLSFGRKGSENAWSIGASEDNILGLGIAANMNYYSNPDRTGYMFGFDAPIFIGNLFDTSLAFSKNDDGYTRGLKIVSPFVSKRTPWATGIEFNQSAQHSQTRLGHEIANKFQQDTNFTKIWWGWANIGKNPEDRHRFKIGFTSDKHIFNSIDETQTLPESREYSYPWFQFRYLSDNYTKMRNIYLINNIEDINMGVDFTLTLGYDLSPSLSSLPYIWSAGLKKASRTSENWLFSLILKGEGNALDNGSNRFLINGIAESFYTVHRLFTLYNKAFFTLSENQYIESPVSLGDNTDLTGYPLQYAHGDHFLLLQSELRYYPNISLFQLVDLGGAVFYGAGKVYGGTMSNNNNNVLHTLGFGIRFFSTRSSNGNTLYLDFARPITKDKQLNRWDWRVRGKSQF